MPTPVYHLFLIFNVSQRQRVSNPQPFNHELSVLSIIPQPTPSGIIWSYLFSEVQLLLINWINTKIIILDFYFSGKGFRANFIFRKKGKKEPDWILSEISLHFFSFKVIHLKHPSFFISFLYLYLPIFFFILLLSFLSVSVCP